MSTGSIRTANLRNFGAAVDFQNNGLEKSGGAQKKAIVLNPTAIGNRSTVEIRTTETPGLFGCTAANTSQPRLHFLKSVLDEFHIPYDSNATVGKLKALAKKELPKDVRDAMKLEDYDTVFRHPLSDYRVTTVLRAVSKEKAKAAGQEAAIKFLAAYGDEEQSAKFAKFIRSQCTDKDSNFSAFSSTRSWGDFKDLVCDILEVYRNGLEDNTSDEGFQTLVGKVMSCQIRNSESASDALRSFVDDVRRFAGEYGDFPPAGVENLLSGFSRAVMDCIDPQDPGASSVARRSLKLDITTERKLGFFAGGLKALVEQDKRLRDLNKSLELRSLELKILNGWIDDCARKVCANPDHQGGDKDLGDVLLERLHDTAKFGKWLENCDEIFTEEHGPELRADLGRGLKDRLAIADGSVQDLFGDRMCALASIETDGFEPEA